jgi:dipeptidyl aminopeptidase/acylaminoacyl peptidase
MVPDGNKIAFQSNRDTATQIFVMNADGSGVVNISNTSSDESYPSWSPDGTKILFTSNRGSNDEIYVMDVDGSNQVNLTNALGTDQVASWSPDGTKVVFETNRDGDWEIYTMNADGSNQTNISSLGSSSEFSGSWSPDGSKILFFTDQDGDSGEIYVMNSDGSDKINLSNDSGYDESPKWQPLQETESTNNTVSPLGNASTTFTPVCNDQKPFFQPDLFQIDMTKNTAELNFTPVSQRTGYMISYSTKLNAEDHGVMANLSEEGVQKYKINYLFPNTTYYFKVRAQNGCMPGPWSRVMSAKTSITQKMQPFYFYHLK